MKVVLIVKFLFTVNSCPGQSIVGIWINEKDPNLTWEFKSSGQLIENYSEMDKRTTSTYQILDRSQSCSDGATDASDETYLNIKDVEMGSFCYYLETLSDEVLVIINADTGKMLIFNRKN